jgi:predicted neuraminidase
MYFHGLVSLIILGGFLPLIVCNGEESEKIPAVRLSEFIFQEAPFASCHASTIEESSGHLVAAWFGGSREGRDDVVIWVSRKVDDKWSDPVEVADGVQYHRPDGSVHRHPCWNPVLFQPTTGPLLLFYKVGPNPREWWGMLMRSHDGGQTWSHPCRLPEDILGPVKNKPVELSDGTILAASSTEHQGWRVHFEWTEDEGRNWYRTESVNNAEKFNAIQPSILFLKGEKLLALGRTREGKVFQVASGDEGRSWGEMTASTLPNPNSGIDAVTLDSGRHLIVYNHTTSGRTPLNVAFSDDGYRWQPVLVLEEEAGEYSYPAVMQSRDGWVHITYTWKRQRIKHVVVDPAGLPKK